MRETVLRLYNQWRPRGHLKQPVLGSCSTTKRAAFDMFLGTLRYSALLNHRVVVADTWRFRRRKHTEKALEAFLQEIGDDKYRYISLWRTCWDIELLKTSEVRGCGVEY